MRLNHPSGQAAGGNSPHFFGKESGRPTAPPWHCPFGEIDLIAEQSGTLLFVEVKYRRSAAFGGTAYSITPSKLAKLQKSAEYYLQQHRKGRTDCRLDAVLIEGGNPPVWLQNITG